METLTFYPFAYALLDEELHNYCWYCLKDEVKLLKCTSCKTAYFCDRKCQSLGWPDHKIECKALKRSGNVPSVETRMFGRIAIRHAAIESGKSESIADFYLNRQSGRSIMDLCGHVDDIKADPVASKKFRELLSQLKDFYGEHNLPNDEVLFQLHCRNYINRHAISDKNYMKEIAKGLYLDMCAYDHSCRPNVVYVCNGIIATLRPLHGKVSIRNRNRTFYTYIDLLGHKEQRQKMLKDTWYFKCECERCLDPNEHILTSLLCKNCKSPVLIFGEKANKDADRLKVTCSKCLESFTKEQVMDAVGAMRFLEGVFERDEIEQMETRNARKFVKDLLSQFAEILPQVNLYYAKLLQAAIRLCDPDNKQEILNYHLQALDCMRVCFPTNHPSLSYHLMHIGMFYCQLDKKESALPYLKEAKEMVDFALGSDHYMAELISSYMD